MNQTKQTNVDRALEAAVIEHENDPERAHVLERARRFKSSWIELAQALTQVRRDGSWKRWGYDSIESYAKTELHLKPETVAKLTGSFQFLQKRAPEVLRRDGVNEPIPSYQAVDFLRRAEDEEDAPPDAVEAMRKSVLEDVAPVATVSRAFRETVVPIDEPTKKARDAAAVRNVAKRLSELLGETNVVPKRLAAETVEILEKVIESLPKDRSREVAA